MREEMFEIHFRDEKPSKDRGQIIAVSVRVEDYINMCLARKLGIKEPKSTRSFGNTSRNLSFNIKLNLFLDLNGISKDEEKLLDKFAVIRNRFAHQLDVETLYDCIAIDPDKAVRKFFESKYSRSIEKYDFNEEKVGEMLPLFLDEVEETCAIVFMRMFDQIGEEIKTIARAKKTAFLLANLIDWKNMTPEETAFVNRAWEKTIQQHEDFDFTDTIISLL